MWFPLSDFFENLAHTLPDATLNSIGNFIVELVDQDDDNRAVWRSIVAECTTYLGMSKGRPNTGQNFPSESNLYSPSLRKAILTMSSKISQSLFPAGAFVKSTIMGSTDAELEDRAVRIEDWFNHYLFNVLKGYKSDKELLIFWYVICGCAFSKSYIDPVLDRPVAPYIHPDDLIISSGGSCLDDAERITHVFKITERSYLEHVNVSYYKLVNVREDSLDEVGIVDKAKQAYGIRPEDSSSRNRIYTFLEVMIYLDLNDVNQVTSMLTNSKSSKKLPYLVTLDKQSKQIVRLVRNYKPDDHFVTRLNPYTQYKLFPGFGPYGMGMAHLALDLAKAETKTMNELVRAGELSNQPSLMMDEGSVRKEFTQINMSPGSINRISTQNGNVNDAIQQLNIREPSQTLFQLMQSFGQSIQDISAIRELTPENVPAGATATTMMGILSTMHIMEDAVINRLYDSFSSELSKFYDLFSQWIPEKKYPFSTAGTKSHIMRKDFKEDVLIIPIIDPNVSSQTFQLIANDTILQLAAANPDLYNMRAVHERTLRSMRISEIDGILTPEEPPAPPPPPPPQLDPVSENQKVLKGDPVQAYKDQDHTSHMTVHQSMLDSWQGDDTKKDSAAAMQSHINDHQAFLWASEIEARMQMQVPDDAESTPPEVQNEIASKAAQAILQKQQEEQAAAAPPPGPSPEEIMMEELKVKQQSLQLTAQTKQQEFELNSQKMQQESSRLEADFNYKSMVQQKEFEIKEKELHLREQELQIRIQENATKLQAQSQEKQAQLELAHRKEDSREREEALKFQLAEAKEEKDSVLRANELQEKAMEAEAKANLEAEGNARELEQKQREAELRAESAAHKATLDYLKGKEVTEQQEEPEELEELPEDNV